MGYFRAAWLCALLLGAGSAWADSVTLVFSSKAQALGTVTVAGVGDFAVTDLDRRYLASVSESASFVLELPVTTKTVKLGFTTAEKFFQPKEGLFEAGKAYQYAPNGWERVVDFPFAFRSSGQAWLRVNEYEASAFGLKGKPFRLVSTENGNVAASFEADMSLSYPWLPVAPGSYGIYVGDKLVSAATKTGPVPWVMRPGRLYLLTSWEDNGWWGILMDIPYLVLERKLF